MTVTGRHTNIFAYTRTLLCFACAEEYFGNSMKKSAGPTGFEPGSPAGQETTKKGLPNSEAVWNGIVTTLPCQIVVL